MHARRSLPRIGLVALLLLGITIVAPAPASAACGGGAFGDPTDYARRAGRIAETIILGRLIEVDADFNYHFDLVELYRGEAPASPIDNTYETDNGVGIIEVGRCITGQSVEPGGLFVYATGPRAERFGPMQLVFSRIPDRGWLINHCCDYRTLDELLVLLGVLPATSTVATPPPTSGGFGLDLWVAVVAGLTLLVYLGLGLQRRVCRYGPRHPCA